MHKKRESWSLEEDAILKNYVMENGIKFRRKGLVKSGLKRTTKCCRARWINFLQPGLKGNDFSQEEDNVISTLHKSLGNRWAEIAKALRGRSDQAIRNRWSRMKRQSATRIDTCKRKCKFIADDPTALSSNVTATPATKFSTEEPNFGELAQWHIMTPSHDGVSASAVHDDDCLKLEDNNACCISWPENEVWDLSWINSL